MNDNFREIGIGIASATTKDTKVGPLVLTEDFGNRTNLGNPYFLGVVYNDKNKDGFYEAGEGIAGATITLTNGKKTYTTTSMTAGGYQIQVPAGTYDVVASGDGLGGTVYDAARHCEQGKCEAGFSRGSGDVLHRRQSRRDHHRHAGQRYDDAEPLKAQFHRDAQRQDPDDRGNEGCKADQHFAWRWK